MAVRIETVVDKLRVYLNGRLALGDLVSWAEDVMRDGEIDPDGFEAVRDAVARLGVADVRSFGLTWEECEALLRSLGYSARVEIVAG